MVGKIGLSTKLSWSMFVKDRERTAIE